MGVFDSLEKSDQLGQEIGGVEFERPLESKSKLKSKQEGFLDRSLDSEPKEPEQEKDEDREGADKVEQLPLPRSAENTENNKSRAS